jgi:hypothetical protein
MNFSRASMYANIFGRAERTSIKSLSDCRSYKASATGSVRRSSVGRSARPSSIKSDRL